MSYTRNTNFTAKDLLAPGAEGKTILGEEIQIELDEIAACMANLPTANDGALTGTTTAVNLTVSGTLNADGTLEIGGVGVTSTAQEINHLGGVTANVQEQIDALTVGIARPSVITDATTARTLTSTDESDIIRFTSGSAVTVTVPADSAEDLPIGFITHLYQGGAGQITVAGAGGVSVGSSQSLLTRAQNSTLSLVKVAADTWYLVGDMEVA